MPDDFEIKGAEALGKLGKVLRSAANGKELRKELLRNLRAAGKPIGEEIKANMRQVLPKKGGMAADFARGTKIGVRSRLSGDLSGVRLVIKYGRHDMPNLDRGRLRHPVYGNRNRWESQSIEPHAITDAAERGKHKMQIAIAAAVEQTLNQIERSA